MKYFALGFLIAFFFEPISNIISYIVEWIRAAIAVKITKCNAKIAELSSETDLNADNISAIGFAIPDDNKGEMDDE